MPRTLETGMHFSVHVEHFTVFTFLAMPVLLWLSPRLSVHFSGGFTRRTNLRLALTSSTCWWGLTKLSKGWRCANNSFSVEESGERSDLRSFMLSLSFTHLFLLQDLMERLDSLLCGDGSESLKSLCLKLLLCLVTVRQNISKSKMNYNVTGFGKCWLCC